MNFGEVRRAHIAKSTLLNSTLVPLGVRSDLVRSVQMLKRERERVWCGKQREAITPNSVSGKTAALVPEFAVEDLPSAELQTGFLRLQ